MIFSLDGIVDTQRPRQGLQDMKNIGVKETFLNFDRFIHTYELKKETYIAEKKRRLFQNFCTQIKQENLKISVAKMPKIDYEIWNKNNPNPVDVYQWQFRLLRDCIKACEEIECQSLILEYPPQFLEKMLDVEQMKSYFLEAHRFCEDKNTKLLLPNISRMFHGHFIRSFFNDGKRLTDFVRQLNREVGIQRFGIVFDTAYANLCGQDMNEALVDIGEFLEVVMIRENNGKEESSALPFTMIGNGCGTDWMGFFRGLRKIDYQGSLILDFSSTAASFSPLLRPELMNLAKKVADFFEWQIQLEQAMKKYASIVLFGAGNMCRNYMKCYGEQYPPLFTCDNNNKLWGTQFEGLEVKSPEALKDLPEDCAVFICNIYYREIEAQLKKIGIKNIEFFNDEYMPSFYFDRLEREV